MTPKVFIASLLRNNNGSDACACRVIFAWRLNSDKVTVRIDVGGSLGPHQVLTVEAARESWRYYRNGNVFERETENLEWNLVRDLVGAV